MKFYIYLITLYLFTACSLSSSEEKSSQLPYHSGTKLSKEWSLESAAKTENGSIKFSHSGSSWRTSDRASSKLFFPIEPGKTYTISLLSKTDNPLLPSVEVSGSYYSDSSFIANALGTIITNSKINTWEKSTVYIQVPNNNLIKKFKIRLIDFPKKGVDGNIWIKDVEFKKGFYLPKNKINKKTFESSLIKIDHLGNIEIKEHGQFKPFFPIGIYTNHKRRDWKIYKKQGFNIAMWCDNAKSIKKAKDAGLYASMQLVQYIMPEDPSWIPQDKNKKIAHLKHTLQTIKNDSTIFNNLLFYYIDNEFYHTNSDFKDVIDIVDKFDKRGDKRVHPIYMLNGNYNLARKYNRWIDFTGTYVAEDMYDTDRTKAFETLNNTQNQTQPAIIAQINRGVGENFEAILFGAIAKGAKGMAFWKDGADSVKIENRIWWKKLPDITNKIDRMMPLIRANNNTDFQVKTFNNKAIIGTRYLYHTGYIIISNPTTKDMKLTLEAKKLPYKIKKIVDYFNNQSICKNIKDNKIEIVLKKHSFKVLKLLPI